MARASNNLSIIFPIVLIVSLLFLVDLTRGRKLLDLKPNSKAQFKKTVSVGEAGPRAILQEIPSSHGLVVTVHDQAVPESTGGPGHSPGVGHLTSNRDNFQPTDTDPGHSPGAGHSTGPQV